MVFPQGRSDGMRPAPATALNQLFAKSHDDERDDQPVQRDGLDQREPDPHIFPDTSLRFRLTGDRLDHLSKDVSDTHARSGLKDALPAIECWENQFPAYDIELAYPEFSSVCPKTGLPDVGTITLRYRPRRLCLETKSLKLFYVAFRNMGIFTENVVNRILAQVVKDAKPEWAEVTGRFAARGGLEAVITARHGRVPPRVL